MPGTNKTSKDFRHQHLMRAIESYGSIEALSAIADLSPQYISQLKARVRNVGDRTARKFESAMGVDEGIWDHPLDSELTATSHSHSREAQHLARAILKMETIEQAHEVARLILKLE